MKISYPNGSEEIWAEVPEMLLYIKALSPFKKFWGMNIKHGIHNQATGNPSGDGVWRRGRKWSLKFEHNVGWTWV